MTIEVISNKQAHICDDGVLYKAVILLELYMCMMCSLGCCVLLEIVIKRNSQVEMPPRIEGVMTLRDLWPKATGDCILLSTLLRKWQQL